MHLLMHLRRLRLVWAVRLMGRALLPGPRSVTRPDRRHQFHLFATLLEDVPFHRFGEKVRRYLQRQARTAWA
jgi:hypothetical protein